MKMRSILLAAALGLSASPVMAGTIAIGDQLNVSEYIITSAPPPIIASVGTFAFTGNGTSFTFGATTFSFDSNSLALDFGNSSFSSFPFNGFQITDITDPGAFSNLTTQAPLPSFNSTASLSGGSILVNLSGAQTQAGDSLNLDFAAPAPTPGVGVGAALLTVLIALSRLRRTARFFA